MSISRSFYSGLEGAVFSPNCSSSLLVVALADVTSSSSWSSFVCSFLFSIPTWTAVHRASPSAVNAQVPPPTKHVPPTPTASHKGAVLPRKSAASVESDMPTTASASRRTCRDVHQNVLPGDIKLSASMLPRDDVVSTRVRRLEVLPTSADPSGCSPGQGSVRRLNKAGGRDTLSLPVRVCCSGNVKNKSETP